MREHLRLRTSSLVLAAALAGFIALAAGSAYATSGSGDAQAQVVTPLTLTQDTAMNFGQLSVGSGGGTVVLNASDSASATGDVDLIGTSGVASADFTVNGEASKVYTITLPSSSVTLTSGVNTMSLGSFTGSKATGTLTAGTDTFSVGATLTVGASKPTGTYTGTYTVTVEYQ